MLIALLVPVGLAVAAFPLILLRAAFARRAAPTLEGIVLGAITNFFDTLGIGSFAPTTAWFKFRQLVPDRLIPPTMLVGHGLPTMAQGVMFLILLGVIVDGRRWRTLLIHRLIWVSQGSVIVSRWPIVSGLQSGTTALNVRGQPGCVTWQ